MNLIDFKRKIRPSTFQTHHLEIHLCQSVVNIAAAAAEIAVAKTALLSRHRYGFARVADSSVAAGPDRMTWRQEKLSVGLDAKDRRAGSDAESGSSDLLSVQRKGE
jgi:hypothetical protein